jgi:hypothetical protein
MAQRSREDTASWFGTMAVVDLNGNPSGLKRLQVYRQTSADRAERQVTDRIRQTWLH